MSENTPTTPEGCRAMAVQCGARANKFLAVGREIDARKQIERARELTLLALKLEADDTNKGRDIDLLPCPHCGSPAKSYHRADETGWSNTDWICCDAGDDGISPDCGAQTCLHETRAQAVAAWNRRAHTPSIEQASS